VTACHPRDKEYLNGEGLQDSQKLEPGDSFERFKMIRISAGRLKTKLPLQERFLEKKFVANVIYDLSH